MLSLILDWFLKGKKSELPSDTYKEQVVFNMSRLTMEAYK